MQVPNLCFGSVHSEGGSAPDLPPSLPTLSLRPRVRERNEKGEYGISNRDKYVILREDEEELKRLQRFFSTKTALYLFEATRYRMKYLEKYIFQLIPDITKLAGFPEKINDNTIAEYFGFSEEERSAIDNLHAKKYKFFIAEKRALKKEH